MIQKKECYIYFSYRLNKTTWICNNKINKDNLLKIQTNFKWLTECNLPLIYLTYKILSKTKFAKIYKKFQNLQIQLKIKIQLKEQDASLR